MAIPPVVVAAARTGWRWQWQRLMGGLGPADAAGNYKRPPSDPLTGIAPDPTELAQRTAEMRPHLVIGRSCPWAHRTWLVHQLRNLDPTVTLLIATADHQSGRWALNPPWQNCDNLLDLYRLCNAPPPSTVQDQLPSAVGWIADNGVKAQVLPPRLRVDVGGEQEGARGASWGGG